MKIKLAIKALALKAKKALLLKFDTILNIKKKGFRINRNKLIISLLMLIIFATITVYYFRPTSNKIEIIKETKTVNKSGLLTKGTPNYKTILPAGKTIIQLGGWTRVSPSNVDPVYAFVDKIGDIPINISQQPLPDELKGDTDTQLASLASDFRAGEKLVVGNTTIYIGTSAKGPQSVIFTKNSLLVLIKSSVQISNDKWSTYINSLQ